MAILRWQPFSEIEEMGRHFDRLFEEMTSNNLSNSNFWQPAIELKDQEAELVLQVQLPGINAKDLDISVTREQVSISGEHRYEKKEQDKGVYRSEFRYGQFKRVVSLPVAVQNDKVKADYKDGILTLTLPKVEEVVDRAVKINLLDQPTDEVKQ